MPDIRIMRLSLKNFKGIRDFTFELNGNNGNIYGDNGSGKTTLFDASEWLLRDKDSQNKKDFSIKTTDAMGNVISGLDHEVEGVLSVDGQIITLRKVFSEKWTKKRGAATAEFSGNTTDYYVDGVPVQLKTYAAAVAQIADEDTFKLLTNPLFFNEQLKWEQRRKILLEVAGDISDSDVIESNKKLAKLPAILGKRSLEDHRKVIAAKRKEINQELEKIPVRIDEASRSMPNVEGLNEALLDTEIQGLRVTIDQQAAELVKVQNGVAIAELEKRLHQINGEVLDIKNQAKQSAMGIIDGQRRVVSDIRSRIYQLKADVSNKQATLDGWLKSIALKEEEAAKLRIKWGEVNGQQPEPHIEDTCPTCRQALPSEQVQAAHDKALADFNLAKSEKLESISKQGKQLVADIAQLEAECASCQAYIEERNNMVKAAESELAGAEAKLTQLESGIKDTKEDPRLQAKLDEYEKTSGELMELRDSSKGSVERIQSQISTLRSQLQAREVDKAKFGQVSVMQKRIEELRAQEKKLASEYEALEQQNFLTEEFIRTKVNLLESRINDKFKHARFKLFDTQINSGLKETCETTYHGVPYSTGLNNAARINIGLDVINTLSAHYGTQMPCFIDNAEAVTQLEPTNGQRIALYVSEKDKQLRVEMA